MAATRQPIPDSPAPSAELKPPTAAVRVTLPQEATGDSESDGDVPVHTACRSSETDEDDDAESCSGGNGGCFLDSATDGSDDDDEIDDEAAATMEVDMTEVDSKMAVPWWRRTDEYYAAARDDGGCCAPAVAAAAEGAMNNAAESNRLFWEDCIAHGY